jgi:hypothetical protein
MVLSAAAVQAHPMGRSVPVAYTGSDIPQARLAAQVIASYFEEQMGRRVDLVEAAGITELFEQVLMRKAPMAVVPVLPAAEAPEGVVYVHPGLDTGAGIFDLVIGADAMKELQFSLVPRYMELLSSGLDHDAWVKGIVMVNSGEGVRKVALEMLRAADLI